MVGAVPGGAGKTTVMCALLNFVPVGVPLLAATPQAVYEAANVDTPRRCCYICHEIGAGSYFAYLWAEALQTYCKLSEAGHILATNLHADDLEQARDQVCGDNDVPIEHFNRFELLIFLSVEDDYFKAHRRIEDVYSSDGSSEHTSIVRASDNKTGAYDVKLHGIDPEYVRTCRDFLKTMAPTARTIEDTRMHVVEFLQRNPLKSR